jgi:hypothetical protein
MRDFAPRAAEPMYIVSDTVLVAVTIATIAASSMRRKWLRLCIAQPLASKKPIADDQRVDTMIELILALLLASCDLGNRIPDWTAYVHANPKLDITASIRYADETGVRWLYLFNGNVLFMTGVDTEHGVCARILG